MKNKVKIFHVRDEKRAMTVAAEVNDRENEVTMGFAFCNDKDNFNKKIGRTKAIGRMNSQAGIITKFTGHSADDIARVFNEMDTCTMLYAIKPQRWRHGRLSNIEQAGLTFVEKP